MGGRGTVGQDALEAVALARRALRRALSARRLTASFNVQYWLVSARQLLVNEIGNADSH